MENKAFLTFITLVMTLVFQVSIAFWGTPFSYANRFHPDVGECFVFLKELYMDKNNYVLGLDADREQLPRRHCMLGKLPNPDTSESTLAGPDSKCDGTRIVPVGVTILVTGVPSDVSLISAGCRRSVWFFPGAGMAQFEPFKGELLLGCSMQSERVGRQLKLLSAESRALEPIACSQTQTLDRWR
jgi:hypothetical protein